MQEPEGIPDCYRTTAPTFDVLWAPPWLPTDAELEPIRAAVLATISGLPAELADAPAPDGWQGTGAAAAALGAYLASQDRLPDDRRFIIHQGHDLGRPSVLRVEVPVDVSEGVRVSGTAVEIGVGD